MKLIVQLLQPWHQHQAETSSQESHLVGAESSAHQPARCWSQHQEILSKGAMAMAFHFTPCLLLFCGFDPRLLGGYDRYVIVCHCMSFYVIVCHCMSLYTPRLFVLIQPWLPQTSSFPQVSIPIGTSETLIGGIEASRRCWRRQPAAEDMLGKWLKMLPRGSMGILIVITFEF